MWSQAELLRLMDVRPVTAGRYHAPAHGPTERDVVEAGQLLGAAVVASAKQVPHQRVVSASMIFSRAAAHTAELAVTVDVLRAGRTFSSAQVQVHQHDSLCCAGVVLLDADPPDLIRSTAPMPEVDPPGRLRAHELPGTVVAGREIRVVGDAYTDDAAQLGPPELFVWTKFRDKPEQQYLDAALLTQSTTHWTVAAALRPHPGFGQSMAHRSISTGITMATITFHDDADVTRWLLYATRVIYAGRGHAHGTGRVYTEDGILVASYTVHAMVRGLDHPNTRSHPGSRPVL
ncbi:acyl-CoA thioesterase [Nocardia goodfellowii]|uniref:Acyl-CoA thioesterase n=1 Tax=Nocardia goodfellowii TaxID=882446 RepID=A0ABS4QJW9_9NOCA|nr:acyl-CoA thioesterase domain-containing protein [Nocardia goodfellowii]MBP2192004.1 acyl-CoA thioesterase [Nocardia goodfellowii]